MGGNAPLTAEVPPDVARVAHQRGLGHVVSTRALAHPAQRFALWLVIGIVCFGLLVAVSSIRPDMFSWAYSVLRFIGLFFCFGGVYAIAVAIRSLIVGSRAYFVFANGFAYRHNGRVQAFLWPDVGALQAVVGTRGSDSGKLVHYNLVTQTAPPIMIPVNIVNGRDEFLDHLIAALTRHGRPIT
jgi:hypothetical protein